MRKVIVEDLLFATQSPLDEVAIHSDSLDFFDVFEDILSIRGVLVDRIASPIEPDLFGNGHEYRVVLALPKVLGLDHALRFPLQEKKRRQDVDVRFNYENLYR